MKEQIYSAGGQAVIEGVMIRTRHNISIAVRKNDGRINIKKEKIHPLADRLKFLGWPFIRGIVNLFEMMIVGVKALTYSANEAMEEDEEEMTLLQVVFSLAVAIGFALILFKFIPLVIAQLISNNVPFVQQNYILFNIIDGLIKIFLLAAYIYFIAFMEDIYKTFQYHGAEHKVVNAYEEKEKLTVENVKKYSTLHVRCGTSFILIVLVISIFFYSFIPQSFSFWAKFGLRVALLPFIAGISYEFLRFGGKHKHNIVTRILAAPGLLIERLSVREPDDKQIEVAIAAMKKALG